MKFGLVISFPDHRFRQDFHDIECERTTLQEVLEDAYDRRAENLIGIICWDRSGNFQTVMNAQQLAIKIEEMEASRKESEDGIPRRSDGTPQRFTGGAP